ncbi:hypothetical protein GALL_399390 [mine drainage metagenome]|uniref:NnrS protein n=1 Tax=mine drainage metagenome TaxID=410659 RepID=A0A1J5Q510_9ZZZZ
MSSSFPVRYRVPILMAGFVSLFLGMGSGLLRLGWNLPGTSAGMTSLHGPLMVCGFLGTVISLERAVAIGRRWAYLAPFTAALGGIALIAGMPWFIGAALVTIASLILCIATADIVFRQKALFTLTLLFGSLSWLLGNLLWLNGLRIAQVAPWWIGFLVLTIAGERLELSRFLPPSPGGKRTFVAIIVLFLMGAVSETLFSDSNVKVLSAALFALAIWLLHYDIARHTIKQKGLARYIAACLLSGYVWLMAGAIVGLFSPQLLPGSGYDAFLHTILIGFVFSMIFGHAPIIFPAVVRVKIPYHPTFYLPLVLLHMSLLIRVYGDFLQSSNVRSVGGMLNAAALLLFVLSTASAVIRGKRQTMQ